MNNGDIYFEQEGFSDPPSVSSISRLLRGGRPGDDGKKDYTIDGILGGGKCHYPHCFLFLINIRQAELKTQIEYFK